MLCKGAYLPAALAAAAILGGPGAAAAESPRGTFVIVDPAADLAPDAVETNHISNILFINRCPGGCTITPGPNDARVNTSSLVTSTTTLSEFAHGNEVFNAVVACVREVYSPYNVVITTEDPRDTTFHHEAILAGHPSQMGLPNAVGGIAPASCEPLNNVISFSFANVLGPDVEDLCWTVAQESAHAFGLPNHVYDCLDPMTYLPGCGRKYFRNKGLPCGDFAVGQPPCRCGGSVQNSHAQLHAVFGEGTLPPPPAVEILLPAEGSNVQNGFSVYASAEDDRLVSSIELYFNGSRYAGLPGHDFVRQSDPYNFLAPDLPDGYIDVEVRARNELHVEGRATHRVLKGAPCTSADTCFPDQLCVDGACRYPPPAGELGDSCVYDQYCKTGICPVVGGKRACSQSCPPNLAGACPFGFECVPADDGEGVCWPEGGLGGGCCSVAGGGAFPWGTALLLGLAALAARGRRRPRRR